MTVYPDKELIRPHLGGIEKVLRYYGHNPNSNRMLNCLFHDDRHASMSIARGFGLCFGCGATTDEFGVIMKENGCDFKTALRIAAEMAGIPTTQSPQAKKQLATTLKRRKHDASEQQRVGMSSEAKYALLCSVARQYRPQSPQWMPLLQHLLDVWLKAVPEWVDVRSLALSQSCPQETGLAVQSLFQRWRFTRDAH